MVLYALQIKAQFENVEKLETEGADFPYFLKVFCSNCNERTEKWHDVTESARTQPDDSRKPEGYNFHMKCKECQRLNTIDIVEKSQGKDGGNGKAPILLKK